MLSRHMHAHRYASEDLLNLNFLCDENGTKLCGSERSEEVDTLCDMMLGAELSRHHANFH